MKIREVPPPEVYYELTLSEDQLVGLGVLSYKHEGRAIPPWTFYGVLPKQVQRLVEEKAKRVGLQPSRDTTALGVDWGK